MPQYNLYVEYWGLIDARDKSTRNEYKKSMRYKMARYHENNIKFISLYRQNLDNLDWVFRAKFREVAGFDLPKTNNDPSIGGFCTSCGRPVVPNSRFCSGCGKPIGV